MLRVNEPLLQGNETLYLTDAISYGEVSSKGSYVSKFEEEFAKWAGTKYAVAVCSGAAALETAIACLGLKEIAVPNYTIISCAIAAIRAGALPKFYEGEISTSALMRCHLFGHFNDKGTAPIIIDDASQYWKPFDVKDVACYSLYANKMITAGEGGVLVTNRKDIHDNARWFIDLCRSKEERFIHDHIGYNFRMSNLQAALALAQLEQIDKFIEIKQKNRDLYLKYLPAQVEAQFMVDVPWMYLIKVKKDAGEVVRAMYERGIECRRNFYPLHKQPCFKKFCLSMEDAFPVSEDIWEHTLYLPSGLTLTEKDVAYVCRELREVL